MRVFVWVLIAILIVIHQDFWFWNDSRLLFGFLPIGLAYHMALSVAAAAAWWLAVHFAWPEDLVEEVLEEVLEEGGPSPTEER